MAGWGFEEIGKMWRMYCCTANKIILSYSGVMWPFFFLILALKVFSRHFVHLRLSESEHCLVIFSLFSITYFMTIRCDNVTTTRRRARLVKTSGSTTSGIIQSGPYVLTAIWVPFTDRRNLPRNEVKPAL